MLIEPDLEINIRVRICKIFQFRGGFYVLPLESTVI